MIVNKQVMKYMGSKNRIAKHILPIILKNRKPNQWYVEPFCGGCNTIDKVGGNRLANDNNKYLIAMLMGVMSDNNYPKNIDKPLYGFIRDVYNNKIKDTSITDDLIGWIGFMGSANGRFFEGGYSGTSKTKAGSVRDYIAESIRNIEKQKPNLSGIKFTCLNYRDLPIPSNSVIYCDIPYKGTKQYSTGKDFNHLEFWQWCRDIRAMGHQIFISEYSAPDDFVCVWQQEVKSSLSANGKIGASKKSIEKLFTLI